MRWPMFRATRVRLVGTGASVRAGPADATGRSASAIAQRLKIQVQLAQRREQAIACVFFDSAGGMALGAAVPVSHGEAVGLDRGLRGAKPVQAFTCHRRQREAGWIVDAEIGDDLTPQLGAGLAEVPRRLRFHRHSGNSFSTFVRPPAALSDATRRFIVPPGSIVFASDDRSGEAVGCMGACKRSDTRQGRSPCRAASRPIMPWVSTPICCTLPATYGALPFISFRLGLANGSVSQWKCEQLRYPRPIHPEHYTSNLRLSTDNLLTHDCNLQAPR